MSKQYDLERFVKIQERDYEMALREIKNGRKQNHWIWYIFPQVKGLGMSYEANYYGIEDVEEAKLYLEHEVLGKRLLEITRVLYELEDTDPRRVMGSGIDALKLKSSMTLFDYVSGDEKIFSKVLNKYYGGQKDYKTIKILEQVK